MLRDEICMAAEPVAGTRDLHDHGVVQKPVEQCSGDNRITEDFTPFREATVRGEDHGPFS